MARKYNAPRHPQIFGELVAILRILAGERSAETATEEAVAAALQGRSSSSGAQRLVSVLDSAPHAVRTDLLGNVTEAGFRVADTTTGGSPSSESNHVVHHGGAPFAENWHLAGNTEDNRVDRGEIAGRESEHSTDAPVYTIRYRGLFCQNETGRTSAGSDKIYIVTSAVQIAADGTNVVETVRHPVQDGSRYYKGVDNNEERVGPVASVWRGTASLVSLVVVVMEHDYGDPDKFKEDVGSIVTIVIEIIKRKYGLDLSVLKDTITDALNWLLQSGDDVVTTEYKVIEASDLEQITLYPPGYYYNIPRNNPTDILYHFVTSHASDDANYIVCFDISRDPSHEIESPPVG